MTVASTKVLGPYSRFAIWVQGCLKCCSGCLSKDSQPFDGGYEVETTDLAEVIINASDIEGITISGGEPFLQSDALVDLVSKIKSKRDVGVIVYTGYDFEEIEADKLTKYSDIIIDGAYVEALNDGLSLRGSSNQNVRLITKRYQDVIKKLYELQGRKIEMRIKDGNATMVGIPDKKTLQIFERTGK